MRVNTKKQGVLRFFIYQDGKTKEFVGLCIDLGIVKFNKNLVKLKTDLDEAAKGYVETIIKRNLDEKLLNQTLPAGYLNLYNKYLLLLHLKAKRPLKGFPKSKFGSIRQGEVFTKSVPVYA